MSSFSMSFNLLHSDSELAGILLDNIAIVLNNGLVGAVNDIKWQVGDMIIRRLESSEAYQSMLNGNLRIDFGLESPAAVLGPMIVQLASEIEVVPRQITRRGSRNFLRGGMDIRLIRSDYPVIRQGYASYISKPSMERIPWLEWLLQRGGDVVVPTHYVRYSSKAFFSRSGGGYMRPTIQNRGFQVEDRFRGYKGGDNWITRALITKGAQSEIVRIVFRNVRKHTK